MSFGSRQDKDDMRWRFLKSFEQGVSGRISEHMDFVYDVDFVTGLVGSVVDPFPELPDVINATIAGSINFYNI